MKRREFSKLASLGAVAITASGFIRFNGKTYEGDCETTTDILGPFYRPNSPVRDNLVIKGRAGELVELSGIVRHKDCSSPYKNAKVELWHCSSDEIYDNDSEEYLYRGTTFCDDQGSYKFTTQMPVPYDAGGGNYRPAHFHLMVSAPGYQSLITQIYFKGDPFLEKDSSSAAPEAEKRIIEVSSTEGVKKFFFDCNMNDKLLASYASLSQIIGKYQGENHQFKREFFEKDGLLWMKNEVFGRPFNYLGDNTFEYGGLTGGSYNRLKFDLKEGGEIKLSLTSKNESGNKSERTLNKI